MKQHLLALAVLFVLLMGIIYWSEPRFFEFASNASITPPTKKNVQAPTSIPETMSLPKPSYTAQSFNNCGPDTLSLLLAMYGKHVSQEELATMLRPFNNPYGGIDDKSVSAEELLSAAKAYGLEGIVRPHGSISLLEKLIAHGYPIITRMFLHPDEDIGHFRLVRGYDTTKKTVLTDDTYLGENLSFSYDEFTSMWEPFNNSYIVIYPKDKEKAVKNMLDNDWNEKKAYEESLQENQNVIAKRPDDAYAGFNIATSFYHLGKYEEAVKAFEKVENALPSRMLWYQQEPILSYLAMKNYDKVFSLTNSILQNGNSAFSELYYYQAKAYIAQGDTESARTVLEEAIYYNEHFQKAKDLLATL